MTISKVAYVQTSSFNKLINFLNKNDIDWSRHVDGADEEEFWVEITSDVLAHLAGTYLNEQEHQECVKENVEYIIFYE